MERFNPAELLARCPKCDAAGAFGPLASHRVELRTFDVAETLHVTCWRCSAPLGRYVPMDVPQARGYGAVSELRESPLIPLAALADSLGNPEE